MSVLYSNKAETDPVSVSVCKYGLCKVYSSWPQDPWIHVLCFHREHWVYNQHKCTPVIDFKTWLTWFNNCVLKLFEIFASYPSFTFACNLVYQLITFSSVVVTSRCFSCIIELLHLWCLLPEKTGSTWLWSVAVSETPGSHGAMLFLTRLRETGYIYC